LFWELLRMRRLAGFRFRRQHPIDHYVLDFYCPAVRVAIELDGPHHEDDAQREHDARRAVVLARRGIVVLRFSNDEANRNAFAVQIGRAHV
jgi:adenine-specific DNA-methyltransferase